MMQSTQNSGPPSQCRGLVVPVICFEEVLERVRRDLHQRGLSWRKFQALYSRSDSFGMRADSVFLQGQSGRVNLYPELKKFMKSHRADFKYKKTQDGRHVFFKSLSNEVECGFAFETIHHLGLGKAFTASFRLEFVQGPYAGFVHLENVFRVYGESGSWPPCWTYSTNDDLRDVFMSVNALWDEIMPIFESYIRPYFSNPMLTLPDEIQFRGSVTAKEALSEAENLAMLWANDAKLNRLFARCYLSVRSEMGPAIMPNGRLRPHAYWNYSFFSPSKKPEILFLKVPFAGTSSFFNHSFGNLPVDQTAHHFVPLGKTWIDSNEAMTIAEDKGGKLAREAASNNFDIVAQLEISPKRPLRSHCWHIEYLLVDDSHHRVDLAINIDPTTGELIKDTPSR